MASPADWSRAIATTIVQHTREQEIAVFRKFKIFTMLEANGNVLMNQSGRGFDWNVRYRSAPVTGNTGDTPRSFARVNMWKRAELPWRGFTTTDAIYKRELLENRGQQALVNIASQMAERLQESLEQHLGYQPYADGTADDNNFHGLQTFMKFDKDNSIDESASTLNVKLTRSVDAADRFHMPNGTYAGLSCVPGYYGGGRLAGFGDTAQAGNVWPLVPVDPEFDFYSPIVIKGTSTGWNNSSTWAANAVFATREGIHLCRRNDTKDAAIDMVVMDRNMYTAYLNALETKERAMVTRENSLRAFGYTDVFEQDGVEITSEYACPRNRAFGLSVANMEMRCLENQLMVAEGPYYSEETQSYRYACSTLGNLRFKTPRNNFMIFI